jgi:hypothetical protein
MVLGGVEIELGHAFNGRKALIGKSLGFPLVSIDITEMTPFFDLPCLALLSGSVFGKCQARRVDHGLT